VVCGAGVSVAAVYDRRTKCFMPTRELKQKAGHYEILGETLAKFEFFEAGWNPYQRYLDVDKVDFILRRRVDSKVIYREIQVKYGKLHDCIQNWEEPLFDVSSWRFFKEDEFKLYETRTDFFLAYVLAHDSGYKQDFFIFPVSKFHNLLHQAPIAGGKRRVFISRSKADRSKWYLRAKGRFDTISPDTCIDVSEFRRNFKLLD
jgi:hypothetical protein